MLIFNGNDISNIMAIQNIEIKQLFFNIVLQSFKQITWMVAASCS